MMSEGIAFQRSDGGPKAPLDATVFTKTAVVDVTSLQVWQRVCHVREGTDVPDHELIGQLIEADTLLTFVHDRSTMVLQQVTPTSKEARSEWTLEGEHVFYTNEENIAPFSARIRVHHTGEIWAGPLTTP